MLINCFYCLSYASLFFTKIFTTVFPTVEVTATPPRQALGGSVTLLCSVTKANPMTISSYTWFRNGIMLTSGVVSTYIIASLTQDDFSATYTCSADNGIGSGNGSTTIEQGCESI